MVVGRDPSHEVGLWYATILMTSVRCLRSAESLTTSPSTMLLTGTRQGTFARQASSAAYRPKRLPDRTREGGGSDLEAAHGPAAVLAVGHGLDAVARRQRDDQGSRSTQLGVEGVERGVGDVAVRIGRLVAQILEEFP